ncbi:MAG: hypothetical protein CME38_00970 [Haliea sp.]|nr:hypothetical protein [Haliea sp.]|tara:strand:+ start:1101 stop:1976 length:876 start_codon:yes stop_codon:yes gene_type:complete
MTDKPMVRLPTDAEVSTFREDGVVCLRGVLDPAFVLGMAPAVDRLVREAVGASMYDMSAMGEEIASTGGNVLTGGRRGAGRFVSGTDHWRDDADCRAFALNPAIARIVAKLLGSHKVNLWEDSVLVKEPDTTERTAWHQDLAYFHVQGDQVCTTWIPLDPATAETGAMSFVQGSHRWQGQYRPNWFVSDLPMPGTEGEVIPDIDALAAAGEVNLLQFDLGPGDMTVHHARTLHSAGGNLSRSQRRRAISLRYCGDDVIYHFRPGAPRKAHHEFVREGDVLDSPDCPVVWRA